MEAYESAGKTIEIGKTYEISTVAGTTFGKITAITYDEVRRETIVNWKSEHPLARSEFWARPIEIFGEVEAGSYLGDDGFRHI
jgi:hypothetical protein